MGKVQKATVTSDKRLKFSRDRPFQDGKSLALGISRFSCRMPLCTCGSPYPLRSKEDLKYLQQLNLTIVKHIFGFPAPKGNFYEEQTLISLISKSIFLLDDTFLKLFCFLFYWVQKKIDGQAKSDFFL